MTQNVEAGLFRLPHPFIFNCSESSTCRKDMWMLERISGGEKLCNRKSLAFSRLCLACSARQQPAGLSSPFFSEISKKHNYTIPCQTFCQKNCGILCGSILRDDLLQLLAPAGHFREKLIARISHRNITSSGRELF